MKRTNYAITLLILLQGIFPSCSSNAKKDTPKANPSVMQVDSSLVQKESAYAELLKKFKPISFDTLEVTYVYDTKDKRFKGKELTLKEAKVFPIDIQENYFGKLSGVYACYQFPLDSVRIGLIARIPGEYEANSVGLFIFDRIKDRLQKEYIHLSVDFGDAGDVYSRISWLIRSKNNQYQSLIYDYSAYYHEVEDTNDHTVDEWEEYYLLNCMSPKFDTISKNSVRLKKQFNRILKPMK